jgi:hypothetical protein
MTERVFGVFEHVRQGTSIRDDGIEETSIERDDVSDIEEEPCVNRLLATRRRCVPLVQFELDRRHVGHRDTSAKSCKFDREATRSCADLKHTVAWTDRLGEQPTMQFETHPIAGSRYESVPLSFADLIEVRPYPCGGQVHPNIFALAANERDEFRI